MNVLVIVPAPSAATAAAAEWRPRLAETDRLFVLALAGTAARDAAGYSVHPVELDPSAGAGRAVLRVVGRRAPALARPLWRALLGRVWPDVVVNVRGFDPDVIDVRRAPAAFAPRLAAALPHARLVTAGATPARETVDRGWRRYDAETLVSVILPVYNGARYLRQSLDSCLAQTHRRLEVIVVDDASTDDTPDIVAEYARADSRVTTVRHASNRRLPGALNTGFLRARGALLTWTSHDNYYAPDALETLVAHLSTWPDVDFVYSAFYRVDESGRSGAGATYAVPPWQLRYCNAIGPYFLYRRRVWETVGEFRPDMEYLEDYEYWVRTAKQFQMIGLQFPRYYYRVHDESMSRRAPDVEPLRRRLWREHFGAS
ncbi:MAG: glycosyltransferase family 2 protein [Candidatus Rokubacteria bacterium]|nr:glycosyltransferase family 2 protein [Candidatus Rokubacteria bacterium]